MNPKRPIRTCSSIGTCLYETYVRALEYELSVLTSPLSHYPGHPSPNIDTRGKGRFITVWWCASGIPSDQMGFIVVGKSRTKVYNFMALSMSKSGFVSFIIAVCVVPTYVNTYFLSSDQVRSKGTPDYKVYDFFFLDSKKIFFFCRQKFWYNR